jgi:hypothetical protein
MNTIKFIMELCILIVLVYVVINNVKHFDDKEW